MLESVFNEVAGLQLQVCLKETPTQVLSCEICEVLKNTFFTEHLFTVTASVYFENLGKILVRNN